MLPVLRQPLLLTARVPNYFDAIDLRAVALTHTLGALLAQRGFAHGGIND